MFSSSEDYDERQGHAAAAAALLYSGVTAARSMGDGLDASLKARAQIASGSKLGAQLFVCGPMFTTEGGHGAEFTALRAASSSAPPSPRSLSARPRRPRKRASRWTS